MTDNKSRLNAPRISNIDELAQLQEDLGPNGNPTFNSLTVTNDATIGGNLTGTAGIFSGELTCDEINCDNIVANTGTRPNFSGGLNTDVIRPYTPGTTTTFSNGITTGQITGIGGQVLFNSPLEGNISDASAIVDSSDNTKKIAFNAAGSTGTTTTLATSQTSNRTLTLPDITDTIVTRTNTETLTNKTLTTPTISNPSLTSISNSTTPVNYLQINGSTITYTTGRSIFSASYTTTDNGTYGICHYQTTSNKSYLFEIIWTVFCTASTGSNLNKTYSGRLVQIYKNAAGTVSGVATLQNNSNMEAGLGTTAINILIDGTQIYAQIQGNSGDTLQWIVQFYVLTQ